MKGFCIIFLTAIIIILSAFGFSCGGEVEQEYLRIHIRANSNSLCDQEIKYDVRDKVVEYLTPIVSGCGGLAAAEKRIGDRLGEISSLASAVLKNNGFSYGASAAIKTESFPTRVYDGYTLEAGEYRALILTLGDGAGENWWCVVYPPLCFTATKDPVYKSKILEIIKRWQAGTS